AGRGPDRVEAGAAETVDGRPADRLGQPREQRSHPRDVAVVLARLIRATEHDVLDPLTRDTRTRNNRADDERREVVRPHGRQRAAEAADARAHRPDDPGFVHAAHRTASAASSATENRAPVCSRTHSTEDSDATSTSTNPPSRTANVACSVTIRSTGRSAVRGN